MAVSPVGGSDEGAAWPDLLKGAFGATKEQGEAFGAALCKSEFTQINQETSQFGQNQLDQGPASEGD